MASEEDDRSRWLEHTLERLVGRLGSVENRLEAFDETARGMAEAGEALREAAAAAVLGPRQVDDRLREFSEAFLAAVDRLENRIGEGMARRVWEGDGDEPAAGVDAIRSELQAAVRGLAAQLLPAQRELVAQSQALRGEVARLEDRHQFLSERIADVGEAFGSSVEELRAQLSEVSRRVTAPDERPDPGPAVEALREEIAEAVRRTETVPARVAEEMASRIEGPFARMESRLAAVGDGAQAERLLAAVDGLRTEVAERMRQAMAGVASRLEVLAREPEAERLVTTVEELREQTSSGIGSAVEAIEALGERFKDGLVAATEQVRTSLQAQVDQRLAAVEEGIAASVERAVPDAAALVEAVRESARTALPAPERFAEALAAGLDERLSATREELRQMGDS
ncbi:MAG: hypothetical protein M3245_04790, partial [Actinomycetota bacterium]|nr:hypothetical protein [Actinomycetota bacterium]